MPHKDKHRIRHGIIRYIQTGEFHPTQRKRVMLAKELDRIRELMIAQTPDMNIKKEVLLNDALRCQGICDLALLYINKVGIFEEKALKRGQLELQPIIKSLTSFMNTKRLNLLSVGLGSKADDVLDVQRYIEQFDEKEAKEKAKK